MLMSGGAGAHRSIKTPVARLDPVPVHIWAYHHVTATWRWPRCPVFTPALPAYLDVARPVWDRASGPTLSAMGLRDRLQATSRVGPATARTVSGSPLEIWGQGWQNTDIVGESFHAAAIRALLGPAKLPEDGREIFTDVRLVHNPLNRQDSNAIEVHASTGLVGHLSREDAAKYVRTIDHLQAQGQIATTAARVWGRDDKDWSTGKPTFVGSIRVDLPEPHMLLPRTKPPITPFQLLPSGSSIRVSAMDGSAAATNPYLCREGECWVHATLHDVVEQGPRSSKQLAEVRIDGHPVGRLTPKMSGDMLPAIQFLNSRGFLTAVRAIIKGNQLKCEVILHTLRAAELPQEWMNAVPAAQQSIAPAIELEPVTTATNTGSALGGLSLPATALPESARAAVPQGWYPDPQGVARLRWWDGATWTQHTAP
jgi:hypothetical protein